jgi:hypothetical protein
LEERFKQRLVYKYYEKNFEHYKYEYNSLKKLESYVKSLCEKCKMSLTEFCFDVIDVTKKKSLSNNYDANYIDILIFLILK